MLVSGCATAPRQTPLVITSPAGIYHVVGSGQTLWRIAKAYNVDMWGIMRVNHLQDPTQICAGQALLIPGARLPLAIEPYSPPGLRNMEKIVGPRYSLSNWRSVTLHHSATLVGNAECFDRNHRERHMGGLFYHFVIGNGTSSGDGEIEVGWRWKKQAQVERPNDIQICLVGNFNKQDVSSEQFNSLVQLVAVLCDQYDIPVSKIRSHKDIRGKRTECPGRNFPFYSIVAEVKKQLHR